MTDTELLLADVTDALNRLALAIAALVVVLIVMSWALDDMALKIHLFGFMVRRLTRPQPADEPNSHAASAAKEVRHEDQPV